MCVSHGGLSVDKAVAEAERALRIDPISTGLNGNLGSVFVFTHQRDKAIEQLRAAIDLDPAIGSTIASLVERTSKKEDCPRRSNVSAWANAGGQYGALIRSWTCLCGVGK